MSLLKTPRLLFHLIVAFAATCAVISVMAWGVSSAHANPATRTFPFSLSANAAPSANTFVVNSTLDQPNSDASTGNCANTASGKCTLRSAVMVANFVNGSSTIIVPSGTFTLTRPGYDDTALVGDLDIQKDITIQGAGSGKTIIDGNGSVTNDRVFQILSSVQNATFSGMTIEHGKSISSTVGTIGGGGLLIEGTGQIHLSDVSLDNNTGLNGGGIYVYPPCANPPYCPGVSLTLDKVTLHANMATAAGVGAGGGVFAYLPSNQSHFTITDSKVYSNTAGGGGGGFYVDGNNTIQWSIQRSEMYSNTAISGGAIWNIAVPLTLSDSYLHDNSVSSDGGAIEAYAPLVILQTTLERNSAGRSGGAISNLELCSANCPQEFVHIAASTLSGNFAQYGGAIYHDGYQTHGSLLTLLNSTLSGNGVSKNGDGGAISLLFFAQAQLLNTTVAGNRVQLSFTNPHGTGIGAGLYITATSIFTAQNSIIANNVRGDGIHPNTADDCFADSGTTGELAYDLITTGTANCSITGPQGGNIFGQDPLLGPLQNNGGSTQTRALLNGSPAIDAGAPGGCTNGYGSFISADQRGAPRPINGRCDMGAFEYGSTPPPPTPTPTYTRTPTPTQTPKATATPTRTPSPIPCVGKPGAPTLLKPTAGRQISKPRVLLDWNAVSCATKYKVIVKEGSKRGTKVDGKTVTVSKYKTVALAANNIYFWSVKACDAAGCKRSVWFSFKRT